MISKWLLVVLGIGQCTAESQFSTTKYVSERQGSRRERMHQRAPRPHFFDHNDIPPLTIVDYGGNHPFERRLQTDFDDDDVLEDVINYGNQTDYNPLRMRFLTGPLEERRGESDKIDAQIDFIINRTLPMLAEQWAKHLSVFSAVSPISIPNDICYGYFAGRFSNQLLAEGVPDADLVVIVSGDRVIETSDVCPGKQLAVASVCSLDQFDRPVVGYINFCLPLIILEQPDDVLDERVFEYSLDQTKDTLSVAIHETGHVLGMNSFLFRFFRDAETGEPLTPRPFVPRTVECVDGSSRTLVLPSEKVIRSDVTQTGRIYFDVITPRVATVARNHFNCQELPGARLENQRVGGSCFGSHWDERLWWTEIMGPRFSGEIDTLSPLTLALLEDSGWYKVSYEGVPASPFAMGRGCDFVYSNCIVNDSVPDFGQDIFCNTAFQFDDDGAIANETLASMRCDPTHFAFALCDLFDEPNVPEGFEDFPNNPVRYFSNPDLVPSLAEPDYCPMLTRDDVGIDCTASENYEAFYPGEAVGINSRCFNAYHQQSDNDTPLNRPACLAVACDDNSRKLVVGAGNKTQICNYDAEVIQFDSSTPYYFECPRLVTICPHLFCPASCSGLGICNWEADPPRCECFDAKDISDGCYGEYARSQVPSVVPLLAPTIAKPSPNPSPIKSEPTSGSSLTKASVAISFVMLTTILVLMQGTNYDD
jgi:hypothetical protein